MATPTDAKICIKCGTDCSGKPRTKDTQGRYTCRACLDLAAKPAAAARPAAPPPPRPASPRPAAPKPVAAEEPGDMDVMSALMKDSPVIASQCPQCGIGMTADSVICTACGYNKETGRSMGLKVERAARDKAPRSGPGVGEFFTDPTKSAFIALAVFGVLFVLSFVTPISFLVYALLAVLYALVFGIMLLVDAFRQGTGTGLLYLFVPLYPLYYLLVRCESAMVKTHMCLSILVTIGLLVLSAFVQLPEAA